MSAKEKVKYMYQAFRSCSLFISHIQLTFCTTDHEEAVASKHLVFNVSFCSHHTTTKLLHVLSQISSMPSVSVAHVRCLNGISYVSRVVASNADFVIARDLNFDLYISRRRLRAFRKTLILSAWFHLWSSNI